MATPRDFPVALAQTGALLILALGCGAALQSAADAGAFDRLPGPSKVGGTAFWPLEAAGGGKSLRLEWLPLAALDVGLLWDAAPRWASRAPSGALQLCLVSGSVALPTLLGGWLMALPRACSALWVGVALVTSLLAALSALLWSGALPLPYAPTPAYSRAALRRSLLLLAHAPLLAALAASEGAEGGGGDGAAGGALCAGLAWGSIGGELRGLSEHGSAAALLAQIGVAAVGAAVVILHGAHPLPAQPPPPPASATQNGEAKQR